MMHLRGNPLDFNNWATITSDPSWGYEGVLPYFIQSEHFVGETTDSKSIKQMNTTLKVVL